MLIYDLADPVELQGFVRNINPGPLRLIRDVLPGQVIDDIEYRFLKGDLTAMDVASYRAFDAEAGVGTRNGVSRVKGELPPISKKMVLGEEQIIRRRALARGSNVVSALSDQIFDDAGRLAVAILGRYELAAGDALVNGTVTINENGVSAVADFGYTSANRKTAAVSWLTASTDVLTEYTAWVEAYVLLSGGQRPAYLQTSLKMRNALLRNTSIQAALGVRTNAPVLVTNDQLNSVLTAYDLPPIVTYDSTVQIGGTATRVIADDRGLLLPPDGTLGATFTGTTAEAEELVSAQQISADMAPGLTAVTLKEFDPVAVWTKVAAIGIPTIKQPLLVMSLDLVP